MAFAVFYRITGIAVCTHYAASGGPSAFMAKVFSAIFALIDPHPRAAKAIRVMAAVRTSRHCASIDSQNVFIISWKGD